jgi:hypothetical protein
MTDELTSVSSTMFGDWLAPCLFVAGILTCVAADLRLRRGDTGSVTNGFITAAGAGLVFVACAAAIR